VRISKPARPEVIRASIVLVSHLGQGGRLMIMLLAFDEAGALPNYLSPMGAIVDAVISKSGMTDRGHVVKIDQIRKVYFSN
jgi:hypothetical protein